jgi:hypothetical protein
MILSNAARLKPEIRLAEAVSHFEASLSSDEKARFRNQRAQVLKAPPDTTDVMRFTAQIRSSDSGQNWKVFRATFHKFPSRSATVRVARRCDSWRISEYHCVWCVVACTHVDTGTHLARSSYTLIATHLRLTRPLYCSSRITEWVAYSAKGNYESLVVH